MTAPTNDAWRWMSRVTQATSVAAFAVTVSMAVSATRSAPDTAPRRAALAAYEAGRYDEAFPALAELADAGDADAARLAALMVRRGPRLYGQRFVVAEARRAAWARLAGETPAPARPRAQPPAATLAAR